MASGKSRKRGVSWRLGAVVMVITIAAAGLVARLVQLQVIDHSQYAAEARDIHVAKETVTGRRGAPDPWAGAAGSTPAAEQHARPPGGEPGGAALGVRRAGQHGPHRPGGGP